MLFYDGFIKKIKSLEEKYYEVKLLYKEEKSRDSFDLYNKIGEIENVSFRNNDEKIFFKELIYSYALKKFSDINELEPITNNFETPTALIINSVLLNLERTNINLDEHIKRFEEEFKMESETPLSLFLKELYDYYIENETITEEQLDMAVVQKGMLNENGYEELRKLLFKSTAMELIVNLKEFETLDEIEKKLAKYSILFGCIGNEKCREVLDKDLREIAGVYYDESLVDEEKILAAIKKIDNAYEYFAENFKKSYGKKGYDFSKSIECFENLILAKEKSGEKEQVSKEINNKEKNKRSNEGIPNFSAERFEPKVEEIEEKKDNDSIEDVEEVVGEIIEEENPKLEILVDSIKSAKELKEETEETEELHKVIEELIPAKEMIRRMKAKKQEEIIKQVRIITEKLKDVNEELCVEIDFTPLDDVIRILEDKGYKLQSKENKLFIVW